MKQGSAHAGPEGRFRRQGLAFVGTASNAGEIAL